MLSLKNVSAQYGVSEGVVHAVSDIHLTIQENEIFGIAGESGCGKSTLLKLMYDNVQAPLQIVRGSVELSTTKGNGQVTTLGIGEIKKTWWKTISYIPQGAQSVLNPVMKIEEQFLDAVSSDGKFKNKTEILNRVRDYIKQLELPVEVLKSYPHQLSGGMRQRVIIALATFLHPDIVLADEPTTALDVVVQRAILTMLKRVQKVMKNTMVLVSHDMGVHYQITDRMGIMYAGRLVEVGPTDLIFSNPLHPYTNALIKSLPRVGDNSMRIGIAGRPPSLLNPPRGCSFAARCPIVKESCTELQPVLREVEPNHFVECLLY